MKSLQLLLLFLIISSCKKEKLGEELLLKSKGIHERVMTLDTHVDIDVANFTDSINYSQKLENFSKISF